MNNKVFKSAVVLLFSIIVLFSSCSKQKNKETQHVPPNSDSFTKGLVADTIIYDVIIINHDSNDVWKNESLKHLKRLEFIDSLFALAYNSKADAYDLFSGDKLSYKDLKRIESEDGFSRNKIGKIQFREVWYLNSNDAIMHKKVYSIVLGIEDYSESGKFRGYAPVFKLNLN